jgi:hypothetical protein
MDRHLDHAARDRRRRLLVSDLLNAPPTLIRPATAEDWPAIVALRAALFAQLDRPVTGDDREPFGGRVWHVAERRGRVAACVSWLDFAGGIRYVYDLYRDPDGLIDLIRLARWVTVRSDADGVEPTFAIDVRNVAQREAVEVTDQWEAVAVLYRRKR